VERKGERLLAHIRESLWHLETWLVDGDSVRRAGERDEMTWDEFENQRSQGVRYAIFKRNYGTKSDGNPETPPYYERIE